MKKTIKNNLFLFGYIRKYAWQYIPLIFVSALFQALSSVLSVLGIKYIMDAIEKAEINYAILAVLMYLLASLIVRVYVQWTNFYFPLLARKVSIGMTIERISASQKLDFQCYDIPEYYDAYSRALQAGEQQVSSLVGASIAMVANITTLISISSIITSYSPWFLLIAILDTGISYMVITKQNKQNYDYSRDNTRINRKESYYKNICLSPNVQKEDKIFGVIEYIKEKYISISIELSNIQHKYLKRYNTTGFIQAASSEVLLSSAMIISVILIGVGKLSLGEFVSSLSGVKSLAGQLLSLIIQFPKLMQNARYADDYRKIVDYHGSIEDPSKKDKSKTEATEKTFSHSIEFKNVSFKYPTCDSWVLENVSFSINIGEKVALVGENGAGKTTIIKLILRLYDPTEGTILFDGIDLKDIPVDELRKNFTSIFQDYSLYNGFSLRENIWFDCTSPVESLLSKVGLLDKYNTIDHWNRPVSKQFADDGIVLSGGEAQRLCIARALSKNSPFILLDEPSSSLDPMIEDEIIKLVFGEAQSKTMLVITHRLSMCTLVDKIIYVENGHLLEIGNHTQLMNLQKKYFDLFNTQAKKYKQKGA